MSDPNTPATPPAGSTPPPPPPPTASPATNAADVEARKRDLEQRNARQDEADRAAAEKAAADNADADPTKPEDHLEKSPPVAGAEQVQQRVDEETARGYIGTKVDPLPDEAYTLATGPDSPTSVPDDHTRVEQHAIDPTVQPPKRDA